MAYAPDAPRCCACGMPGPLHNLRFSSRHITSAAKSRCHNCSDVMSREKSDKPRAPRARSDGVRDFFVYVKHLRQQSGLSAKLTIQWAQSVWEWYPEEKPAILNHASLLVSTIGDHNYKQLYARLPLSADGVPEAAPAAPKKPRLPKPPKAPKPSKPPAAGAGPALAPHPRLRAAVERARSSLAAVPSQHAEVPAALAACDAFVSGQASRAELMEMYNALSVAVVPYAHVVTDDQQRNVREALSLAEDTLGHGSGAMCWHPLREAPHEQQKLSPELEQVQEQALLMAQQRAQVLHERALATTLPAKVAAAGSTMERLHQALAALRDEQPVAVYIHAERIASQLLADTRLRNLFETGTGSGSHDRGARNFWELTMFPAYAGERRAGRRPKYGMVNFAGHVGSVPGVEQYGDAYFELAEGARSRVTVTHTDSSVRDARPAVGTLRHAAHVVDRFTPDKLAAFLRGAGTARGAAQPSGYAEAQVHGQVFLLRDISRMVLLRKMDEPTLATVQQLCDKNGIELIHFFSD